ncbi:IclR family transcriptional regulator [Pelovirga terrestris]|uniref:IclR family transcriptional regulator n=1 Tax=Pelovirga terrestris TaxID=2771352 RepID=A0A8J6QWK0_9BACT|nr:IclR family transcriptional regulator [Pelovirga terrestris]MBD1399798.1 IclR family transcriptional regulator [Pelovirga terrestris]
MSGRDKDSYNIRSVENALHLLEALASDGDRYSLAQLSDRLDMTKASLFRLMATFENMGYVERGEHTGEYQLGMGAFETSQKLLARMPLLRHARPVMSHLARQCDESVYLVVRRGQDALFLEMADNDQKVNVAPLTSHRFALERCAPGKLMLAFSEGPLAAPENTTSDQSQYRSQRYCVDHNGLGEGSSALAVPLFQQGQKLAGCLTIVAPTFRMNDQRINSELLPALKAAGDMISARLGYNLYSPKGLT